MAVVIETTLGDIIVDLYLDQRPVTCLNFLKLCKMKYYNFNLFHTIRSGFIAQTGDPTGEGSGGQSIFGLLEGPDKRFFSGEKMPKIRHTDTGLLSMVCTGDMMVGSQFFFTLGPDLDSLDGIHCVIGEVTEGHDVLRKLNDVICDETHRPYRDVRITHTVVLEDPFNDPAGLRAPSRSPSPNPERLKGGRIAPDEELDEAQGKSNEEIQELIEEKEAKARATILEIVGDIPDADIAPPENVLFVCKLNPVTTDEDLEIIFSRFGKIVSCEVIRDKKTGDSLQYAFIEFDDKKSCEDAYFKMDNVLIDDRRIHVDFSQSVSKIKWLGKGRGVKHINDDDISKEKDIKNNVKGGKSHDKYDKVNNYHRERERHRDSDKKHRNDRNYGDERMKERSNQRHKDDHSRNHNARSRSRSRKESSRNESTRGNHNNNDNDNRKKYHKSQSDMSPARNNRRRTSTSPTYKKKDKKIHESQKDKEDKYNKHKRNHDKYISKDSKDYDREEKDKSKLKHKLAEEKLDKDFKEKKSRKEERIIEPQTPSPVEKGKIKDMSKEKKLKKDGLKKNKNLKRKRKQSSSSSSSDTSSSSTSSSDSSSSSESDHKKRARRKKKKLSTSSSSSSSSTDTSSSSSSSDSSSDSSSSSSDSEPRKKKLKKAKPNQKSMKKLKKK